jgi:hypothetical protein
MDREPGRAPMLGARRVHLVAALVVGRRFRIITLGEDFTRECLGLVVDTSLTGVRVARELDRIAELRNYLRSTRETDASTVSATEEVSSLAALTHRCHFERILRKRPQKFGLGLGQMNPRGPVLGTEYNDLSVVIGRDVRAGRCGQHRKRWRLIALSRSRDGGDRRDRRTSQREAVLGLRVLLAGELEES